MKTTKTISTLVLAAVLAGWSGGLLAAAKAPQIAVIVRADGSLSGLGLKEIKAVYTGEKLFEGSNKIEPILNGDEAVEAAFLKKILEKTKAQYRKIWNSKAFVDGLTAPTVLPDSSDVLKAVYKSDNAVGFVLTSDISPSQMKYLKVIFLTE